FHRQQPQQLRWQQRRRQSQSLTSFDADNDDDSGQLLRCGDCEKKLQCEKIDSFSSIDNDNFSGVASRLRRRSVTAGSLAKSVASKLRFGDESELASVLTPRFSSVAIRRLMYPSYRFFTLAMKKSAAI
ncbi:unnamed protein product, partial [Brassica oleracea var. botrytis]